MLVCGHGDVSRYCEERKMMLVGKYDGDIGEYNGVLRVLVTDAEMSESEYFLMKGKMLARGVELVSTRYDDSVLSAEFTKHYVDQDYENRSKRSGRCKFGFRRVDGELIPHEHNMSVAKRILELRDKGFTLREIHEDENICRANGQKLSVSTIQYIIKNRKDYE